MAPLKQKGDLAELKVAADLIDRGCRLSIPYGEDCDYDLIADFDGMLHRVQVKYTESDGEVVHVRCRSHSLTNGKIRRTKRYTAKTIDWIAIYDRTSDRCYYFPASQLGEGRSMLHLRLVPARNGQRIGIRDASEYINPDFNRDPRITMEPAGLEPATSRMQTGRSSS
jgi:Holliday junction resolvase-like predicted endonuclease